MIYKKYIFFSVYILFCMHIIHVWSTKTILYSHDNGKHQDQILNNIWMYNDFRFIRSFFTHVYRFKIYFKFIYQRPTYYFYHLFEKFAFNNYTNRFNEYITL